MTTLSTGAIWLAIGLSAIGTFLIRYSFVGIISAKTRIPETVKTALAMVPAAVMAALVAPALIRSGGSIDLSLDNLRLIAGIAAGIATWRVSNMLVTISVGMGTLWLLQWLVT